MSIHLDLCRRHLLENDDQDDPAIVVTSERLSVVGDRLRVLTESMTENGAPATPTVLASWVEAVGWFHGWAFPLLLTSPDS